MRGIKGRTLVGRAPPLCFPLLGDVASAEQAEGDEEGDSDWSEQSGHESNSGGSEGSDGQPVISPLAPPLARCRPQTRAADSGIFINLISRKAHRAGLLKLLGVIAAVGCFLATTAGLATWPMTRARFGAFVARVLR